MLNIRYEYEIIELQNELNAWCNNIWKQFSKSFFVRSFLIHCPDVLYKIPFSLFFMAVVAQVSHGHLVWFGNNFCQYEYECTYRSQNLFSRLPAPPRQGLYKVRVPLCHDLEVRTLIYFIFSSFLDWKSICRYWILNCLANKLL